MQFLILAGLDDYATLLQVLARGGFFGSQQSNLHYTRRITPKRVTNGGAHLRGLAPGLYSSEETSQRW